MAKARRNKLTLKKEDDDQRDMFTMPKTFLDAPEGYILFYRSVVKNDRYR